MYDSPASIKFDLAQKRALILYRVAGDKRLRPQSLDEREAICHAAHAAVVAAWNAYVVNLVRDFLPAVAKPTDIRFHSMHTLVGDLSDLALKKFNTPNTEKTREIFVRYTGYDPINDWIWPQRKMGGLQVRDRLNEILQVRHSFAHGFPIPAYSWTQHPSGHTALTKETVNMTSAFFSNLVRRTDKGLIKHMREVYGVATW